MKKRYYFLLSLLLTLLTGCNLAPPMNKPDMELPCAWELGNAQSKKSTKDRILSWWMAYKDPLLTALIEEALEKNDDVWLAAARVEEARGIVLGKHAERFPNLGYNVEATRTGLSNEILSITNNTGSYTNFTISALLSYEVDLWGRMANASKAACANLLSKEYNQQAVVLGIAAEVANSYFAISAFNEQIAITEETIRTRKEALELEQKRFDLGDVDELVLRQAQANVSSAESVLPPLIQERAIFLNSLSILLGRSPKELVENFEAEELKAAALPSLPMLPEVNASHCILNRPDIMAAEETLVAANANIGVARASCLPTLSLSGLLGQSANTVGGLFNASANTWTAAGALAGPLLDFGRSLSKVEVAQALENQAYIQYAKTVRIAFGEVADNLKIREMTTERLTIQTELVGTYRDSLRLSRLRFNNGYVSYLEVVDAERNLFLAQIEHVLTKRNQLQASVNLYKALGGPCID